MKVDVVSLAAEFPNDNPALHGGVIWVCPDVTGAAVAIPAPICAAAAEALTDESVPSMSLEELVVAAPLSASVVSDDVALDEPALAVDEPEPATAPEEIPVARISGIVGLGETPRDESEHELSADADDGEPILVEDLPPLDETATLEGVEPAAELASTASSSSTASTSTLVPRPSDDPWMILLATLSDVAIGAGSPHVASLLPALLLDGTLDGIPEDARQALAEADVFRANEVTPAFVAQTRAWRGILLGTSDDFAACGNAMLDEWAADLLARLLGAPSRATALKRDLRARGVAGFGLVEAA